MDDDAKARMASTQFKPGVSGNPGGRPNGTRLRLSGKFLAALEDDFNDNGKGAIVKCREEDPGTYVKVIAALLPKQIEQTQPLDEFTDTELAAAIAILQSQRAATADAGANAPPESSTAH